MEGWGARRSSEEAALSLGKVGAGTATAAARRAHTEMIRRVKRSSLAWRYRNVEMGMG